MLATVLLLSEGAAGALSPPSTPRGVTLVLQASGGRGVAEFVTLQDLLVGGGGSRVCQ